MQPIPHPESPESQAIKNPAEVKITSSLCVRASEGERWRERERDGERWGERGWGEKEMEGRRGEMGEGEGKGVRKRESAH